jgi:hypothetical protein
MNPYSPPPLTNCIPVFSILIHTGKGGRAGELTREKVLDTNVREMLDHILDSSNVREMLNHILDSANVREMFDHILNSTNVKEMLDLILDSTNVREMLDRNLDTTNLGKCMSIFWTLLM